MFASSLASVLSVPRLALASTPGLMLSSRPAVRPLCSVLACFRGAPTSARASAFQPPRLGAVNKKRTKKNKCDDSHTANGIKCTRARASTPAGDHSKMARPSSPWRGRSDRPHRRLHYVLVLASPPIPTLPSGLASRRLGDVPLGAPKCTVVVCECVPAGSACTVQTPIR